MIQPVAPVDTGIHAPRDAFYGGQFLVAGPDGAMWMIDPSAPALVRVSLHGAVRSYPLSRDGTSIFRDLTVGPDANLWLTGSHGRVASASERVVRATVTGRQRAFTVYGLKGIVNFLGLTAGPDRALWFTADNGLVGRVGRVTTDGRVRLITSLSAGSAAGITTGPDHALWTCGAGSASRITAQGRVRRFRNASINTAARGTNAITSAGGELWLSGQGMIGRITTSGRYTSFPFAAPYQQQDDVLDLTPGPDGQVWFVKAQLSHGEVTSGDAAGEIDRNGRITLYPLGNSSPQAIAAGPDGRMWITTDNGSTFTPTIYTITPRRPASGWPRAASPQIRVNAVSSQGATVTVACRGPRGLFCGGTVRVIAEQGHVSATGTRVLYLAAGTQVTIDLHGRGFSRFVPKAGTVVSSRFSTKDLLGRRREANSHRRFHSG